MRGLKYFLVTEGKFRITERGCRLCSLLLSLLGFVVTSVNSEFKIRKPQTELTRNGGG